MPQLSATASRNKDDEITLTISNISLTDKVDSGTLVRGTNVDTAIGRILTNKANAYNTFDASNNVIPVTLNVKVENGEVTSTLSPCSVAEIVLPLGAKNTKGG